MMGMIIGMAGEPAPGKKYKLPKKSSKPKFSEEELKKLSVLSGNEKKAFVKKLQEKYRFLTR